jgi:hypothetical protein
MDASAPVAAGDRPCKRRREEHEAGDSRLAGDQYIPTKTASDSRRNKVKFTNVVQSTLLDTNKF